MNKYVYLIKKHKIYFILSLILIFGVILRFYALASPNFWLDESISSLAARKILEKGFPIFDSGFLYSRAFVFHYILASFLFFFNNDLGARLISVLFGTATIILAFFIAREFSSEKKNNVAGLVAALFTAVLSLEVIFSKQARFYQMFQFLFFLTIFFLYKSKENKKYTWFASVSLIILVDTHLAGIAVIPLFFYLFLKEQKDRKLLLIPILILIYHLPNIFGISYSSKLASQYIESYSSTLFYYLRAFAIITIIGSLFAFKLNKRLTLLLIVPSSILIMSLFFIKLYAIRYSYFIILLAPLFISILFSFIYKNTRSLFFFVLIISLVYPSNLFFEHGNLTIIKPEKNKLSTFSEPTISYKELSQQTKNTILNSNIVTLFTPSFAWYYKNPDYFIPFSLTGLQNSSFTYNNLDVYTGAEQFNFESPQINSFILAEDKFGYSKLVEDQRKNLNIIKEKCILLEESSLLKVYFCSLK